MIRRFLGRLRRASVVALVALAVGSAMADPPSDKEGFTRYALAQFQQRIEGHHFTLVQPLVLKVDGGGKDSLGNLYLDRIYQYSLANPEKADAALASYADRVAAALAELLRPPAKEDVTLVVRSQETLRQSLRSMGASFTVAAYPRALTPSLTYLPVLNSKTSFKWVNDKILTKLGLTEEELFRLARANLRSALRPLEEVTTVPSPGQNAVGTLRDELAPSRLLFPEEWAPIAKKLGGKLVVMVPGSDVLIYGDGSSAARIDALRTLGRDLGRRAEQPLSDAVLLWTETGWQEL
jgi:hypothetical protein